MTLLKMCIRFLASLVYLYIMQMTMRRYFMLVRVCKQKAWGKSYDFNEECKARYLEIRGKEREAGKEGDKYTRKPDLLYPIPRRYRMRKGSYLIQQSWAHQSKSLCLLAKEGKFPQCQKALDLRLFSHSLQFPFKDTNLSALSLLFKVFAVLRKIISRKGNVDLVLVLLLQNSSFSHLYIWYNQTSLSLKEQKN